MITFFNVVKSFGAKTVLNGVTFAVEPGELVVLLGPNGAGKSTSMSLLTGLDSPSNGEIYVCGQRPGSIEARKQFAFVPQDISFPLHATGGQMLRFLAAHSDCGNRKINEIVESFALGRFLSQPVRVMSGGQKRLLSIAGAFVRGVPVLVLDEPTVGLDLEVRALVYKELEAFVRGGGTVFMTTHFLAEAERIATRIIALNYGRIVQTGSPAEIKRRFGFKRISFRSKVKPPQNIGAATPVSGDSWCVDSAEADRILKELVAWGGAEEIEVAPLNLEDVFLRVLEPGGPVS